MTAADYIVIATYLVFIIGLGWLAGRSTRLTSAADFFLGGRRFPWWIVGTSMVATTVAADTPLAVAGITINDGVAGNWFWWCFIGSHVLVSLVLARLWRRADVITDAEFCELRYQDRAAPALRGIKAFYFAVPINCIVMGFVILAMLKVAEVLLPELNALLAATLVETHLDGDTTSWLLVGLLIAFTLVYSVRSGYAAVVLTDLVQFPIAIVGSIILAAYAVGAAGGLDAIATHATAARGPEHTALFPAGSEQLPWHAVIAFLGVQWWAQKGADGGGIFIQRMLSARSERDAEYGGLWFMVGQYVIRPWPWILTGLAAMVLLPQMAGEQAESSYPQLIMTVLPEGLRGLLVASFLAAFMSTIDTHLNWGASYIVNDLAARFGNLAERRITLVSRLSVVLLAGVAVLAAASMDTIRGAWEFIIAFGAGTGAVILLRWYWWRITAAAELSAMLASTVLSIVVYQLDGWTYLDRLAVIVPGSAAVWLPITWLTAPDPATLVDFYRRVRPSGPGWRTVARLAGEEPATLWRDLLRWLVGVVSVAACLLGLGHALLHSAAIGLTAFAVGTVGMWLLVRTTSTAGGEGGPG